MAVNGHEQRPPIAPVDLHELTSGTSPLRLENCAIERVTVTGRTFAGAHLKDVVFRDCRIEKSQFERARLENVRFESCEMVGVDFCQTPWIECSAEALTATRLRIVGCHLVGMVFELCTFQQAVWCDSTWEAGVVVRGLLTELQCERTKFRNCVFKGTRFSRPILSDIEIERGTLEGVDVSAGETRGLHVRDTAIRGFDVLLGTHHGLTFEGVSGQGLRLSDAKVQGLSLLSGKSFNDIGISGSTVTGMAVSHWPELSMFSVGYGQLHNVSFDDVALAGLYVRKTEIERMSAVSTVFDGVDFEQSSFQDLKLENVRFGTLLRVPNARFYGLNMTGVVFDANLEVEDAGVTYAAGQHFPAGRP